MQFEVGFAQYSIKYVHFTKSLTWFSYLTFFREAAPLPSGLSELRFSIELFLLPDVLSLPLASLFVTCAFRFLTSPVWVAPQRTSCALSPFLLPTKCLLLYWNTCELLSSEFKLFLLSKEHGTLDGNTLDTLWVFVMGYWSARWLVPLDEVVSDVEFRVPEKKLQWEVIQQAYNNK